MTAGPRFDPAEFLHEHLAQASPDLLRELMGGFINTLLSADADSVCGAAYGARAPERTNQRNGYRHRDLDTRVGSLDVAIPKLPEGSYFWLLERRSRAHLGGRGLLPARGLDQADLARRDLHVRAMRVGAVASVSGSPSAPRAGATCGCGRPAVRR